MDGLIQQYAQKVVYFTTSGADSDQTLPGSIYQMSRVQDVGWTINYPLVQETYNDNSYESFLSANNSISMHIRWFNTNCNNEQLIGLATTLPPSGVLGYNLEQEQNIYISVENTPGLDAVGASGAGQGKTVLGMAQALMSEYHLSAQVGGIINAEATFNCLTSYVYSGSSGFQVPAVHHQDGSQLTGLFVLPPASSQYDPNNVYEISAIAARDLIMQFPTGAPFSVTMTGENAIYLQSMNLSLTYDRHELKPLGYQFPPHRAIMYPMHIDLTTEAIVSSYQADQLQRISCLGTGQAISIIVKQPCSSISLFGLYFTELQLESQDFVTTIGEKDMVSIKWKGILSNPFQTFFNPFPTAIAYPNGGGSYGTHW